jgi:hypothetical protein
MGWVLNKNQSVFVETVFCLMPGVCRFGRGGFYADVD